MKFIETELKGAFIIELSPMGDERGSFCRSYCPKEFKNAGLMYEMVQSNAMKVWETPEHKRKDVYKNLLKKDENVIKFLNENEIDELFNITQHLDHIDYIFDKVFT